MKFEPPTPFVRDPDFELYVGDVSAVLAGLPDESVHCVVTSPPYWGLRDYGTGSWSGGDAACQHRVGGQVADTKAKGAITAGVRPGVDASRCLDCGAVRVDLQLGLESTPEAYVDRMVGVFREVRRVLRSDGTCWLNIGDSYNGRPGGEQGTTGQRADRTYTANQRSFRPGSGRADGIVDERGQRNRNGVATPDLKPKDLVGIPWRLAFALQADGWYLRSDIIWSKPNPMPESVTDRPTKAHEYLFLLTRSPRYFYDADAIREPAEWARWGDQTTPKHGGTNTAAGWIGPKTKQELQGHPAHRASVSNGSHMSADPPLARNKRSVWEIATEPYPDAHFATFPQALVEPCIKAGCPEGGTVLDPFLGSGTTALVARRLGRRCVGIELNPEYADLAAKRLSQLSLLAGVE